MTVTSQTQGRALGHHGAKCNLGASGCGSFFYVHFYVPCMVVVSKMVKKILGEGTQFYLTYRCVSAAKCKNGLRVLKIWMTAQTPEKRGFGYSLLVLPYCERIIRWNCSVWKTKRERHKVQHHKVQPPLNTVRKQLYAPVNNCLLALTKLQLISGLSWPLYLYLETSLVLEKKGCKSHKAPCPIKTVFKTSAKYKHAQHCKFKQQQKNAYFLKTQFLAPFTLIQTQAVNRRILLYFNYVWKHWKLQFRY